MDTSDPFQDMSVRRSRDSDPSDSNPLLDDMFRSVQLLDGESHRDPFQLAESYANERSPTAHKSDSGSTCGSASNLSPTLLVNATVDTFAAALRHDAVGQCAARDNAMPAPWHLPVLTSATAASSITVAPVVVDAVPMADGSLIRAATGVQHTAGAVQLQPIGAMLNAGSTPTKRVNVVTPLQCVTVQPSDSVVVENERRQSRLSNKRPILDHHGSPAAVTQACSSTANLVVQTKHLRLETTPTSDRESVSSQSASDARPPHRAKAGSRAGGRRKTTAGRSSHRIVEQNYRRRQNDMIKELGDLVVDYAGVAKHTKGDILTTAIDCVTTLKEDNAQLRRDNDALAGALRQLGGDPDSVLKSAHGTSSMDVKQQHSPNYTNHSPMSAVANDSADRKPPAQNKKRGGVTTLATLLLAFGFFAPLSVIFGYSGIGGTDGQRNAHSSADDNDGSAYSIIDSAGPDASWWEDGVFRLLCLWLLNGLVVACLLVKFVIYGEPNSSTESMSDPLTPPLKAWTKLIEFKPMAHKSLKRGDYQRAVILWLECLQCLGRPPYGYNWGVALLWHLCRHCLNCIGVGVWLANRAPVGNTIGAKILSLSECKAEAARAHSGLHTAVTMLQIADESHSQSDAQCTAGVKGEAAAMLQNRCLAPLAHALAAVNLAECAQGALQPHDVASIYVMAALRLKLTFGNRWFFAKWFQRYMLWRARKAMSASSRRADAAEAQSDVASPWFLLADMSTRFWLDVSAGQMSKLLQMDVDGMAGSNSMIGRTRQRSYHPLVMINDYFVLYMLEMSVARLLSAVHVADYIAVHSLCDAITSLPCSTHIASAHWLSAVCQCAAAWQLRRLRHADDDDNAEHMSNLYNRIRAVPKEIVHNQLILAVGYSMCSRKLCWELSHKHTVQSAQNCTAQILHNALIARKHLCSVKVASETLLVRGLARLSIEWLARSCVDIWLHSKRLRLPAQCTTDTAQGPVASTPLCSQVDISAIYAGLVETLSKPVLAQVPALYVCKEARSGGLGGRKALATFDHMLAWENGPALLRDCVGRVMSAGGASPASATLNYLLLLSCKCRVHDKQSGGRSQRRPVLCRQDADLLMHVLRVCRSL